MGVASLTLMLVWLLKFRGGISVNTDNIQRDFNGHPFFMLLGLIFLGGQAIMAYKTIPGSRRTQKFVHLFLHLMALGLGSLGLYAAFKFHKDTKLADMYSLHSWLGMGAFVLYGLQASHPIM
ncbi:uncharacterized protein A4U43_C03F15790 [Asparagus officinalis]|uniref:Cytochrome b561 domain-containing protein n=1 Tax=Asparagus officinalis TaxID=4686 RepID=A0A5P1FD85_ASPOF|nr:uncharacterized protein A4U43_C03F15790 [Asparagus officinalis]